MDRYFGTYQRFEAISEKEAGYLLNADNLVGDEFALSLEFEDGKRVAWLSNKFGKRIGYFDEDFSRKLGLVEAMGWESTALLSFIAYTEEDSGGKFWGEMAVIAFDPRFSEPFGQFRRWLGERLRDGVRPKIDFDGRAVEKVIESGGAWTPDQTMPLPQKEKGTVIMKDELSLGDKVIEQARRGNPGCYLVSWGFVVLFVVGAIWAATRLLG